MLLIFFALKSFKAITIRQQRKLVRASAIDFRESQGKVGQVRLTGGMCEFEST